MRWDVKKLREDFPYFVCYMFTYLLPNDKPTGLQLDIARYLQQGPKRSIIQAFRGVGKTLETAGYAAWRVWQNPDMKVLVVSASSEHAKKITKFTRQLFDILPVLQHLAPRKEDVDIATRFNVHGILPAVQPTFSSIGIEGQLQGQRGNLLIADDVESQKNSYTVHQREKLWETVKEFDSILNSDEDTGYTNRIIYLGTPQTEETLYTTLIRDRGYDCRIWPVRVPRDKMVYRGNLAPYVDKMEEVGKPTDPSRFNEEEIIDRELSYGRSSFARQFMLNPELGDSERFPLKLKDLVVTSIDLARAPTYLAWCNDSRYAFDSSLSPGLAGDRFYRPFKVSDDWTPYSGTVMAIDPAGKGKDEVGYAVVKHLHGMLFVTACGGLKGGYADDNMQYLADVAKTHNVNHVVVESNFGMGMFSATLKKFLTVTHPCVVEDVHATGQKEKRIIGTLEPVMNQHKLVMSDTLIHEDMKTDKREYRLFFQMTRLSEDRGCLRHDDRLDALAAAVAYWTDNMAQDSRRQHEDWKKDQLRRQIEEYEERLDSLNGSPKAKAMVFNTCHKA